MNVYASDVDASGAMSSNTLKHVTAGDSIMSLLSFLDHLAGHNKPYKTVSAKATENSKIIKLPYSAFKVAFEKIVTIKQQIKPILTYSYIVIV